MCQFVSLLFVLLLTLLTNAGCNEPSKQTNNSPIQNWHSVSQETRTDKRIPDSNIQDSKNIEVTKQESQERLYWPAELSLEEVAKLQYLQEQVVAGDGKGSHFPEFKNQEIFNSMHFGWTETAKKSLFSSSSVRWVTLARIEVNKSDLEFLSQMTQLKGLIVGNCQPKDFDFRKLNAMEDLRILVLNSALTRRNKNVAESFKGFSRLVLPNLESLNLVGIASDGILPTNGEYRNLKSFSANSSQLTNNGLELISKNCPNLESLNLANCAGIDWDGIKYLESMPRLRFLHLGGTRIERIVTMDEEKQLELQQLLPNGVIGFGS